MCGVGAISLSKNSKVNARELGHHLLSALEWRGNMASGFAYAAADGSVGLYKEEEQGSQLKMKGLPRNAKTAIFHTRMATHGDPKYNENNHPVISPNQSIALVHNGVVWNHDSVRRDHLSEYGRLADVDSIILPALIEKYGIDGTKFAKGDAAVAWIKEDEAFKLNIARLSGSPMAYTSLLDGSFVAASTESLLIQALNNAGLEFGAIRLMLERDYFVVENGIIMVDEYAPEQERSKYSYNYNSEWDDITSGGHGYGRTGFNHVTNVTPKMDAPKLAIDPPKPSIGSSFGVREDWEDIDNWSDEEFEEALDAVETARKEFGQDWGEKEDAQYNQAMALLTKASDAVDKYYTIDVYANFKSYRTMEDLEHELAWFAGLTPPEDEHFSAEGLARWCNHFADIGSLGDDPKSDELNSWVGNKDDTYMHEDPNGDSLAYIRDGISYLEQNIGA